MRWRRKAYKGYERRGWSEEEIQLVGTMSDLDFARKFNRLTSEVVAYRRKLKRPAFGRSGRPFGKTKSETRNDA